MKEVFLLSLVTASISFTISEATLFDFAREWLKKRHRLLGVLVNCCHCLGYWVAFGLVVIYRPRLFESWWLLDYFLTALVIAWLSSFQGMMMCWLMGKAKK